MPGHTVSPLKLLITNAAYTIIKLVNMEFWILRDKFSSGGHNRYEVGGVSVETTVPLVLGTAEVLSTILGGSGLAND